MCSFSLLLFLLILNFDSWLEERIRKQGRNAVFFTLFHVLYIESTIYTFKLIKNYPLKGKIKNNL